MHRAVFIFSVSIWECFINAVNYSTIINGKNPIVAHEFLGDDVAGKMLCIVDDMIASEEVCDVANS